MGLEGGRGEGERKIRKIMKKMKRNSESALQSNVTKFIFPSSIFLFLIVVSLIIQPKRKIFYFLTEKLLNENF